MATKAKAPGDGSGASTSGQVAQQAGFIQPAPPPMGVGASALIQGYRPPFVLLARLDRLEVSGGLILPDLARVEAVPGRAGNTGADTHDPAGAVSGLERIGFRRVPDTLDFTCWGQPRSAAVSGSTYRDYYRSDRSGGVWCEAWIRPRAIGGSTRWTVDMDGKRNFQKAVLAWLLNGAELDEDLAEAACRPAIETCRDYAQRASNPAILARLTDLMAQIPAKFIPADLAAYQPKAAAAQET